MKRITWLLIIFICLGCGVYFYYNTKNALKNDRQVSKNKIQIIDEAGRTTVLPAIP
ncbi:MAG: hypothetical protein ACI3ZR_00670 [bacterium]